MADGDPASDTLLAQNVFLPYSPLAPAAARRLFSLTLAAARAGYPLRVALIASPSDLGVVPSLYGHPASYARFLSSELAGTVSGPVLVVMPAGFGLANGGRALSVNALAGLGIAPGADGLARAAESATLRLATAAGHPLAASAATGGDEGGASPGTVRHALIAIAALGVLAGAGVALALRARTRRAGAEHRGPPSISDSGR